MRSSSTSTGWATALALAAAAAGCRAPEGTPDAPRDTSDRPFVTTAPLSEAESARNDRFEDLRRTRFQGAERLDAAPVPASSGPR